MNVLEKLLFNLTTISEITRGQKINTTRDFISIEPGSMIQGYWRWRNSDSRDRAISIICREVRTAIYITDCILESKFLAELRLTDLKKIRLRLIGAAVGIKNICDTYEDAVVSGNLQPLLVEIHQCVDKMTNIMIGECGVSPAVFADL